MLKKVLLADESKPSLILISEILKDLFDGLALRAARTAPETLEIFSHTPDIDLVIVDIKLSGAHAIDVVKKIKGERNVPVFVTVYKPLPEMVASLRKELEMYPESALFLEKPVEHNCLLRHMEKYTPHLLPQELPVFHSDENSDTLGVASVQAKTVKTKLHGYETHFRKV